MQLIVEDGFGAFAESRFSRSSALPCLVCAWALPLGSLPAVLLGGAAFGSLGASALGLPRRLPLGFGRMVGPLVPWVCVGAAVSALGALRGGGRRVLSSWSCCQWCACFASALLLPLPPLCFCRALPLLWLLSLLLLLLLLFAARS